MLPIRRATLSVAVEGEMKHHERTTDFKLQRFFFIINCYYSVCFGQNSPWKFLTGGGGLAICCSGCIPGLLVSLWTSFESANINKKRLK